MVSSGQSRQLGLRVEGRVNIEGREVEFQSIPLKQLERWEQETEEQGSNVLKSLGLELIPLPLLVAPALR